MATVTFRTDPRRRAYIRFPLTPIHIPFQIMEAVGTDCFGELEDNAHGEIEIIDEVELDRLVDLLANEPDPDQLIDDIMVAAEDGESSTWTKEML